MLCIYLCFTEWLFRNIQMILILKWKCTTFVYISIMVGWRICIQIKTHMQSKAAKEIAVGHQHPHESMLHGLRSVFQSYGFTGLWRGVSAAIPRVMVGSATQLSSFTKSKEYLTKRQVSFHFIFCIVKPGYS